MSAKPPHARRFAKGSNLPGPLPRLDRCEDPLLPLDELCGIEAEVLVKTASDELDGLGNTIDHLYRNGQARQSFTCRAIGPLTDATCS